jgi:hypothetical protein
LPRWRDATPVAYGENVRVEAVLTCKSCGRRGKRNFLVIGEDGTRAYRCDNSEACENRRMTREHRQAEPKTGQVSLT